MLLRDILKAKILNIASLDFEVVATEVFHYQYRNNRLYKQFCDLIGRSPDNVREVSQIPFLPISFFKHHTVLCNGSIPSVVFESSTTTGQIPSRHSLCDEDLYLKISEQAFTKVFGPSVDEFEWLALLPAYLDRPNSSLVYMVSNFIAKGGGGFYNRNQDDLIERLSRNEEKGIKTILIGVSFALLQLAHTYPIRLDCTTIVETGGMKGRGPEVTRHGLHETLKIAFGVDTVASEYGMTELTSQGWSSKDGRFEPGPPMRVLIRQLNDPFARAEFGERGAINCIDLGNLDTCAFVATDDVGIAYPWGEFEVLGRLDGSELRGCNLMF